jgi:hypothetical protein
VSIPVPRRLLARWDDKGNRWQAPQGTLALGVGLASDQVQLRQEVKLGN